MNEINNKLVQKAKILDKASYVKVYLIVWIEIYKTCITQVPYKLPIIDEA